MEECLITCGDYPNCECFVREAEDHDVDEYLDPEDYDDWFVEEE